MRMFAKIDGIPGESTDAKHKDEIDVLSFSWGVSNPVAPGGGGGGVAAGRAAFEPVTFSHTVDKASPLLAERCALGQNIKSATITQTRDPKGADFLQFKFEDVVVTAVAQAGAGSEPLSESVSMVYGKVQMAYSPQKADGTLDAAIKFGFDVAANKKI